jgi:hypothetical protein
VCTVMADRDGKHARKAAMKCKWVPILKEN